MMRSAELSVGVDRRRFIALAAGLLAGGAGGHAHASGLRGCCILPSNASSAYRATFNKRPTDPDKAAWRRRLGDASGISAGFESALGELLVDMSGQFGVKPGFGFYDVGDITGHASSNVPENQQESAAEQLV